MSTPFAGLARLTKTDNSLVRKAMNRRYTNQMRPSAGPFGLLSRWLAMVMLLLGGALGWSGAANAVGNQVDMTIVDRESGATAQVYQYRGNTYVAGSPGAKYAIRVANRTGQRVLAVMSVDGVNIITGQTGAFGQSGYVLGPWQSQEITGWRKSNNEVAAFVFTSLPDSYAARTGRPNDVGVIGVAVFNERPPIRVPAIVGRADQKAESSRRAETGGVAADSATNATGAAVPAAPQAAERIGTGHGERESSYASTTRFTRSTRDPVEVTAIQYDSYSNLVRAGIITERRPATPFPRSQPSPGFVPDPPKDGG